MTKNRGLAKTPYMAAQRHFWDMVLQGDRASGCWLWPYATNGTGYGYVNGAVINVTGPVLAHRASFIVTHPGRPRPEVVRHRCDTPLCFNPDHLEPGSHADNVNDKKTRSPRHTIGESNPCSKLSAEDIREIRRLHAEGVLQKDLGAAFGVTQQVVSRIVRRVAWRHVA